MNAPLPPLCVDLDGTLIRSDSLYESLLDVLRHQPLKLLDHLDTITLGADGAVYPTEDARMSPAMFRAGYLRLEEYLMHRDPAFLSSLTRRLKIS